MSEKIVVIHPIFDKSIANGNSDIVVSDKSGLSEAIGLAMALELDVQEALIIPVRKIKPASLFGQGAINKVKDIAEGKEIGLVFVNCSLSPIQQRNLEKIWNSKVIDRTGLILEIFGARARTKEGKLQVELAALDFQRSRLVRSWTHLERQRGGFGFVGGPGETQIEIDRRLIGERIVKLKKQLEHVRNNRQLQRSSRKKVPFPVVALVGYTNAGKSTLFNKLTGADVFAKDLLFATLDTTMRLVKLPSSRKVILSDTVGFISNLPTHLVAAFRATLEEVQYADIILYIRDTTNPDSKIERESVEKILKDMNIDIDEDERVFEIFNKIDLLTEEQKDYFVNMCLREDKKLAISAVNNDGLEKLLYKIDEFLSRDDKLAIFDIDMVKYGASISWIYNNGYVKTRSDRENITCITATMSDKNINQFQKKYPDIKIKIQLNNNKIEEENATNRYK